MHDDIFIVPTIFFTFGFIVWTIATNIRRSKAARAVADLHTRVLDKCAASQDLLSYLESDAGRQFLESAGTETTNPSGRILNAVQAGFILSLVGGAFLAVRAAPIDPDASQILLVLGSVALAIGVGFLLSAATSYVLCKNWGLLNPMQARK
ncbi:MAG: hypothetical protein JO108_28530 [Acidobacteriaceae bacterium]|nr:hypothetical protein [Acidobacteriaceae bacterium]